LPLLGPYPADAPAKCLIMTKKIQSALISVFSKQGLDPILRCLERLQIRIYSTGGTQQYIEQLGIECLPVEGLTHFPSILGGRVKTLHPSVFGGILGRRNNEKDREEMKAYEIPEIDLVIVDLYPFEATLAQFNRSQIAGKELPPEAEQAVIDKIDIGGPSMIRAAAKNFHDLVVVASNLEYPLLERLLQDQQGETSLEQRKSLAARAFEVVTRYDLAISNYFHPAKEWKLWPEGPKNGLRYGENPHQRAEFFGDWTKTFEQVHGKEISYNNLVDIEAAIRLVREFRDSPAESSWSREYRFAIIKHTNVCGIASRPSVAEAWKDALAGDPESAFGGVLVSDGQVDLAAATGMQEIFFEVLIAPDFHPDALVLLKVKKNRILLKLADQNSKDTEMAKSLLGGWLMQQTDEGNIAKWEEAGGRDTTDREKDDLLFANLVSKHLKSNAIALVCNKQLVGKGCGQTSRVDALRQAIEKSSQFRFDLRQAVLASDAFFPFDDCVRIAHAAGIQAFIQPGGSIRDKDSFAYCREHGLAMVVTGMRHFKH
jgi:phosphoribosylaminoimidazolecarboxamide formyltransferase/IMP cyclohydrolase